MTLSLFFIKLRSIFRISSSNILISLPRELKVDFNEPEYPKSVQDQILLDNHRLEKNLITEAGLLVEQNKDLTIEEAESIVEANRQKNQKLSIFETIRNQTQRTE